MSLSPLRTDLTPFERSALAVALALPAVDLSAGGAS